MSCYGSPRWTGELLDCSMPMTLDQYSTCGFFCTYCFAFYQRAVGPARTAYLNRTPKAISLDRVKGIFARPDDSEFGRYIKRRLAIQWGGMSDPFDRYEREMGVGLELLRFLRALRYPVSISTKGTWWLQDPRYRSLIEGATHFHFKVSIITLNAAVARQVEVGVDSPQARIEAIRQLRQAGVGGVTLRLRPVIPGISVPGHLDTIRAAAEAGADSVSTEFLCIETRATRAQAMYERMSRLAGVDLLKMYKAHSRGAGYLRLSRAFKVPVWEEMEAECRRLGLRLHVSDAHGRDFNPPGMAGCCGCPPGVPVSRGHFGAAIDIARTRATAGGREAGLVRWSDIEEEADPLDAVTVKAAAGFNNGSPENEAKFHGYTLRDYMKHYWDDPRSRRGPCEGYGRVLVPVGHDEAGHVVYRYNGRL